MTDFGKLVPAWVHTLASYKPGKPVRQAELESGVRCIKMASNENPFGPSPLAIEAIKAATSEVNYYPDNCVTELTARWRSCMSLRLNRCWSLPGQPDFWT